MKDNKAVILWLFTGCFMIMIMVMIGGITRLTGSGLSMVEWKPLMGTLPPMNETEWSDVYEKYKAFPEFSLSAQHKGMNLEEFKEIFFWEYIHRLWGRVIGLVFIIPFIYFLIRKKIKGKLLKHTIVIFILGGLQGAIGWIMVKSGLKDLPHVSHYRLALHLITAFFLYCYILWVATDLWLGKEDAIDKTKKSKFKYTTSNKILLILVVIQIIYGAFMSGLKAGMTFPSFPLMNGKIIPANMFSQSPWLMNFVENHAMVQFIHRSLATAIAIYGIFLAMKFFKNLSDLHIRNGSIALIGSIILQFSLGIITVLAFKDGIEENSKYSNYLVFMGTVHQMGALILLTVVVFLQNRLSNLKAKTIA